MLYGSMIWTSCNKENLLKVLRLQKRARIILDAERTAPSVNLFNTLKWVPFYAPAAEAATATCGTLTTMAVG